MAPTPNPTSRRSTSACPGGRTIKRRNDSGLAMLALLRLSALTGQGREDRRCRAIDDGFNRYLAKPVEPDGLEPALRSESAG